MPTAFPTTWVSAEKPRPVIARANSEQQKEHKKKLRAMISNPVIDLWANNEVHFQQHRSRCYMWIAPDESDPVCSTNPTRKSVGYFGTVRSRDGKFIYRREADKFNVGTFGAFLKRLRKVSFHSGKKFFVISDNAR
jgi:hypothetical protein